jgi:hypothetical protein
MGDDYQVIARAVRRPMQRWWRRVGVWWVALIVVLLGVKAIAIVLDRHYTQVLPSGNLYKPIPEYVNWLERANALVPGLYALLWLLAAFQVLAAIDSLARDSPVVYDSPRFLLYRFRLVLAQAPWPVALATAFSIALSIGEFSFRAGARLWRPEEILSPVAHAGDGLAFLVSLMWLGALVIQRGLPRPLLWLWWVVAADWSIGGVAVNLLLKLGVYQPALMTFQQVEPFFGDLVKVSAFVALAATVCLLAARRPVGMVLAYILGALFALSSLRVGLRSFGPQPESAALFQTYTALAYINRISPSTPAVWMNYYFPPASQLLSIHLLLVYLKTNLSIWLCWIALPFQALIAWGYYWFIRGLLVLGASRRSAGT